MISASEIVTWLRAQPTNSPMLENAAQAIERSMKMTNEYQDLLADVNACGSDALDCLVAGDVVGATRWLKALLDTVRENMDDEDSNDAA